MDLKKMVILGLVALAVLTAAAPAEAWFGPCGFGGLFGPFGLFPFGLFGCPVPVPVPVPVPAAPLCAPPLAIGGCGLGPCGLGGCGLGACGLGNSLAIPGPC